MLLEVQYPFLKLYSVALMVADPAWWNSTRAVDLNFFYQVSGTTEKTAHFFQSRIL